MSDQFLINQLKNKDKVVFKKIYKLYFEDLVNYANKYVFDYAISEDIVQEVFVYLWLSSSAIKIKTSLKSYVYAMVKNRSLNYLKAIKLTDTENYIALTHFLASDTDLFSNSDDETGIKHSKILETVGTMPTKMQQIFKLKFFQNYKYSEIADELNISINTVKTQLKRARVKIDNSLLLLVVLLLNR